MYQVVERKWWYHRHHHHRYRQWIWMIFISIQFVCLYWIDFVCMCLCVYLINNHHQWWILSGYKQWKIMCAGVCLKMMMMMMLLWRLILEKKNIKSKWICNIYSICVFIIFHCWWWRHEFFFVFLFLFVLYFLSLFRLFSIQNHIMMMMVMMILISTHTHTIHRQSAQ